MVRMRERWIEREMERGRGSERFGGRKGVEEEDKGNRPRGSRVVRCRI